MFLAYMYIPDPEMQTEQTVRDRRKQLKKDWNGLQGWEKLLLGSLLLVVGAIWLAIVL